MFVVPIQTYILIYKKIYEHWGVAGTLMPPSWKILKEWSQKRKILSKGGVQKKRLEISNCSETPLPPSPKNLKKKIHFFHFFT